MSPISRRETEAQSVYLQPQVTQLVSKQLFVPVLEGRENIISVANKET